MAIRELGPPIYAVGGEWLPRVSLGGLSGSPCQSVLLRHRAGTRQIEVTTGRRPLGGTTNLLHRLMVAAVHDPELMLPFELRVEERLVMVPVGDGRQQFRVLEASTGHWEAAGGYEKRHLALSGTPGTRLDDLALVAGDFATDIP